MNYSFLWDKEVESQVHDRLMQQKFKASSQSESQILQTCMFLDWKNENIHTKNNQLVFKSAHNVFFFLTVYFHNNSQLKQLQIYKYTKHSFPSSVIAIFFFFGCLWLFEAMF